MSNKKFPKLAVLSLLGVLALTGCDSSSSSKIKAKPSDYNDPIVTIDGNDEKIHNDILSIIYDAMRDGQVASKTLEKVLYRYAQSVFGPYNKVTLSSNDDSITLKEAAANEEANTTDKSIVDNFVRAHKAYWDYNDKGEHIDGNGQVIKEGKDFNPTASERTRVSSKFHDIEDRIAEAMYSKISSGSYTEKHFFSETKFVKSLYEDGQDVEFYKNVEGQVPNRIVDYTLESKDVFTEGVLHREFYQTNYNFNEDETKPTAGSNKQFHYIEKEVLPSVYGDLLVEQYLLDEEASAVRNSRARQINVIKIEKYTDFTINADLLVKELVKEIYSVVPAATDEYVAVVDEDHNPYEAIFEKYQNISKGLYNEIQADPDAVAIVNRINATRSDAFEEKEGEISGVKYYANTAYGDLVEDYEEFQEATNYDEIKTELLNKFTSNGTVTPEEGFDQAVIDIDQTKAITKGWYVQKSAPSLDSNGKIKDNLFQVSVANSKIEVPEEASQEREKALQTLTAVDRLEKTATAGWTAREKPADGENKFLCSINGAFFLKFEGNYSGSDYKNDIVYDDGSAYYIVQVLEAVKDVKLRNSQSANSYANTRSNEFLNKATSEVTKKVAETGNYSSLSKEYWLEKMSIKFHDQTVYDYFKENYPDLFD